MMATNFRHAEPLRVGNLLEQDLGPLLFFLEVRNSPADIVFDNPKSRPLPKRRRKSPAFFPPVTKRISCTPALTSV
jgi:hypothetical protein